jgi:hypothetical protein
MTDAQQSRPEFLIEVAGAAGPRLEASSDRVIKGSKEHLEAAATVAEEAAETLGKLFHAPGAPDGGSIEFGLSFEAEGGVPVFAKGRVGATITVTLNWDSK